jgi:hypothetical protein
VVLFKHEAQTPVSCFFSIAERLPEIWQYSIFPKKMDGFSSARQGNEDGE